jgi:hypothetical protein
MARRIGGRADQRRCRPQRGVALNPIVIERLRRSSKRRAVEDDIVVGEPDCYRPPAVLNAGAVVAAHAVADAPVIGVDGYRWARPMSSRAECGGSALTQSSVKNPISG